MLYNISLFSLGLISFLGALFALRPVLLPRLPPSVLDRLPSILKRGVRGVDPDAPSDPSSAGYSALPSSSAAVAAFSWGRARAAGLTSTLFDIEANIRDLDARQGLDESGAAEVSRLMQQHGISFDEARLMRHKAQLQRNRIDPLTGMPLDSKAVTFESLRR